MFAIAQNIKEIKLKKSFKETIIVNILNVIKTFYGISC
jgi:hypothetical protein